MQQWWSEICCSGIGTYGVCFFEGCPVVRMRAGDGGVDGNNERSVGVDLAMQHCHGACVGG